MATLKREGPVLDLSLPPLVSEGLTFLFLVYINKGFQKEITPSIKGREGRMLQDQNLITVSLGCLTPTHSLPLLTSESALISNETILEIR